MNAVAAKRARLRWAGISETVITQLFGTQCEGITTAGGRCRSRAICRSGSRVPIGDRPLCGRHGAEQLLDYRASLERQRLLERLEPIWMDTHGQTWIGGRKY